MVATAEKLKCEICGKVLVSVASVKVKDRKESPKACVDCMTKATDEIVKGGKKASAKSKRGKQGVIPGSGQEKFVDVEHEGHELIDLLEEKKHAIDAINEEHNGEIEAQDERMKAVMKEHDIRHYHDPVTGLEIDLDEKIKAKRKSTEGSGVS